ncbi:TPA: SIR2 family protein [Vibrio parahaemolyticus]|uniref:SIR2-like domain-containing protein n=1 Tax=Vibrio ordalii FS-238 TaxID=617133 RepID=A0A853R3F7_9VIBR|nr:MULTISPECIES: SIR2 family protein [Vibrio]EGQ7894707.1 hypothetical protein [Vibrio parahaemolyticus]EGQ8477071.1 hypothetical protein [Vibrio parahaemolyticus]EGR1279905.1 hypothetical protein [Vibrio parahaemolyticus]EGR1791078.1 hypothetical protein [Vibrio parahaemolyticus]EGR1936723.1 hypothetical protein [Vibrio parahaemolyticus]
MESIEEININDIWQNNVNLLIGSGASYGLFPTLETEMDGESIETLGKYFEDSGNNKLKSLLFMHYYISCIEPVIKLDVDLMKDMELILQDKVYEKELKVIENYKTLLNTLRVIASKNKSQLKSNIFTTNYDSCFTSAYEELLLEHSNLEFNLNDGTKGFRRKFLEVRNFDSYEVKSSMFGKTNSPTPQANIVHLHGCAYWNLNNQRIAVDYQDKESKFEDKFFNDVQAELDAIKGILNDKTSTRDSFGGIQFNDKFDGVEKKFWETYNKLPVVNPTKWKFHETVFDEHYYQMLRLMSYELEKQDSTLVVFGFSFADEHITNLVKRSLGNKSLTMYICCFDDTTTQSMENLFHDFNNVKLVTRKGTYLTFDLFNTEVFKLPS